MRNVDPTRAWLRSARAQRRVGAGAVCACGENRPFALISGREPPCCYRCEWIAQGREPYEDNHVFGRHNSAFTIRYPINDHRAVFSVKQLDWTEGSLENVSGSPLLEGAARLHGLHDNITHMLDDCLAITSKFRHVEDLLTAVYGVDWMPKLEAHAAQVGRREAKGIRKSRPRVQVP